MELRDLNEFLHKSKIPPTLVQYSPTGNYTSVEGILSFDGSHQDRSPAKSRASTDNQTYGTSNLEILLKNYHDECPT